MRRKRYPTLVFLSCLIISSSPSYADSTGKFSGVGSLDAYNRSLGPGEIGAKKCEQGDYQGAIPYIKRAIAIYPYDAAWYQNLGIALSKVGKLEDSVIAHNKAVELEPKFHNAWICLGTSYELLNKLALAEKCYRKAVELKSNYEATVDLGDVLRQQKKYSEAQRWLLRARELRGADSDTKFVDKCLKDCSEHLK